MADFMAAELADFVERWPDKAQLLYKFSGWTLHKDMRVEDEELDPGSAGGGWRCRPPREPHHAGCYAAHLPRTLPPFGQGQQALFLLTGDELLAPLPGTPQSTLQRAAPQAGG